MPTEKLERNLLGLARVERAHANGSAPATVTNGTTLEVKVALVALRALRVEFIHHGRDVDASVTLSRQIKLVLLEFRERVEKRHLLKCTSSIVTC